MGRQTIFFSAAVATLLLSFDTHVAGQKPACDAILSHLPFNPTIPTDPTTLGCPAEIFMQLRGAKCLNCDKFPAVARGSTEGDYDFDPHNVNTCGNNPFCEATFRDGYDVDIDFDVDCYVEVLNVKAAKSNGGKLVYRLVEEEAVIDVRNRQLEDADAIASQGNLRRSLKKGNSGKFFLTHKNQCGVCSDLKNLASFLQFPTFEQEITACGVNVLPELLAANGFPVTADPLDSPLAFQEQLGAGLVFLNLRVRLTGLKPVVPAEVFEQLSFCIGCVSKLEGDCLNLWAWNVIETISKCGAECLRVAAALLPANNPNSADETSLCLPGSSNPTFPGCPNYCEPASSANLFGCPVTINEDQACYEKSYEESSEYRLNLCLQCDECHNYATLLNVGGRIRRNSGIVSGIKRPEDLTPTIGVDYGLCGTE